MPSQSMSVSTLDDVLQRVQQVFSLLGDGTPVMVGEQYRREPGPGGAPRVVFVPESKPGSFDAALKISSGYVASWTHKCTAYVRGAETGDDSARLTPSFALAARVVAVLKALDPGHIVMAPGEPEDDSPTPVDGPGADVTFTFSYVTNIAQDPAIVRAVKQLQSVSPPDPDRPRGDTGNRFIIQPAVAPIRP